MKKILFSTLVFLILGFVGQAQDIPHKPRFKAGIRAGLSTSNLKKEVVEEGRLAIAIKEAKFGFHIGFFARGYFSENIYLQSELLFNSNSIDFEITNPGDGLAQKVLNENYQHLDIPLLLGYQIGAIRLEGGLVGHAYLASKTELDQINGYEQRFNDFTLGYRAGIGFDIWNLLVDAHFEGNFNDFGEHMHVGEQQINFSQSPARWVMTLGYAF